MLSWAGFKGAVTYTFDDANASQIQHYGELNGMGVPLTFFLITSKTATRFRTTTRAYIAPTGSAACAYDGEIDAAQSAGGWRIVLVHGFTGGTDGAFQPVSITEFTASVGHAKSLGNLWIDTMINIGAYWRAQKVIAAVVPTLSGTSGTSKTWTWTLPAHYPPGKYLRVSVPGGTVTQRGQTIAWNDHGYYEIALDAGAVTVGP